MDLDAGSVNGQPSLGPVAGPVAGVCRAARGGAAARLDPDRVRSRQVPPHEPAPLRIADPTARLRPGTWATPRQEAPVGAYEPEPPVAVHPATVPVELD